MSPSLLPVEASTARPHWRSFLLKIVSPSLLTFGLFLGLIFLVILPAMKRVIIDRKKEMIRELTQAAWSELDALHQQEQAGQLSRAAAQAAAIGRIEKLRFGDDAKDYFWICDLQPRMICHPYRPELKGQDLADYTDPGGKKLFVESARLVRESGQGYLEYLWQWKDDQSRVVPKLSYVMGFAPWGWVIGTGIYLEDVRAEINKLTGRVVQVSLGISVVMALLLGYIAHQGFRLERDRSSAESALRASEAKYRLLLEATTEGVLLVLADRPVYANPALLSRLGYTEQELGELTLGQLLQPTSAQHAQLLGKQGVVAEVALQSVPIQIGAQPMQMLSLQDVTGHKRTEETMARLLAELQTSLPLTTRPIKTVALSSLACELSTPIQLAAAAMARAKSSAILVKSPDGQAIGIVTDADLRNRVLAAGRDLNQPVASIMSAPLVSVSDQTLLFEAARLMQERALQHLVVTDEAGTTLGVLAGTEILHAQRHAVGLLVGAIEQAHSVGELRDCQRQLPALVKLLLDHGTRVENVTRVMSSVADAITVRLLALAEAELGPPPVPYTFLALGSVARGEQTLATDQDNALIYADVPAERQAEVQAWFERFGAKICNDLAEAGYQRCRGQTMAANPKWCQPLSRWRSYFTECVRAANPQDLLDINIFFDLRCVSGEPGQVTELRQLLQQLLADGRAPFFFHLAQSTLQFRPPRGFFGNIQVEPSGEHADRFNIKSAIIPLVNFARLYALRHHFAETNTLDRLRRLRDGGLLLPASHDELVQAYTALMQMRLTHQAAQCSRGEPPDNHIDLGSLTQLERSVLKKVFADIAVFQARLETDFARTV